jgi:hypothetical protein
MHFQHLHEFSAWLLFMIAAAISFGRAAANIPSRIGFQNLGLMFVVLAWIFA